MRKMIVLLLSVVATLMAIPVVVEAQVRQEPYYSPYYNRYDSYRQGRIRPRLGYRGYSYDDPAYLQQMMSLPEGLAACEVDLASAKVAFCRPIVKEVYAIEAYLQNPGNSLLGTIHVEKQKFHFRPFDDTNKKLGTFSAGALGAGAGAMVGYGSTRNMRSHGKANAIGAGATIGGGLLAGWLASRHTHDNCLTIEPMVVQSGGLVALSSDAAAVTTTVSSVEHSVGVVTSKQPIAGPAVSGSGEGEFELFNSSRFRVEVYYDEKYLGRLNPGASLRVNYPEKDKRYQAHMLVPNEEGGISSRPARIVPGDSGLTFSEPEVAQGR